MILWKKSVGENREEYSRVMMLDTRRRVNQKTSGEQKYITSFTRALYFGNTPQLCFTRALYFGNTPRLCFTRPLYFGNTPELCFTRALHFGNTQLCFTRPFGNTPQLCFARPLYFGNTQLCFTRPLYFGNTPQLCFTGNSDSRQKKILYFDCCL